MRVVEMITKKVEFQEDENDKLPMLCGKPWEGPATIEEMRDPVFQRRHGICFDEGDSVFQLDYYVEEWDSELKEWVFVDSIGPQGAVA